MLHDGPRGRLLERLVGVGEMMEAVVLEHALEEPLLAPEGEVEARRGDAHGLRELGQRGALVAVPPEEVRRQQHRLVDVEDAGARHGLGEG